MVFHLDSGYMQRDCNNLLASNLVILTAQRNITAAMHVRVSNRATATAVVAWSRSHVLEGETIIAI